MANNYFANFFNPVFQQQMYSQLEEYLNNTDDSDRNDLKNSENNPIKEVNY